MFRDYDFKYLILSVFIATCVCGLVSWYEISVDDSDSVAETALGIGQGIGIAVATAILTLAWWEVVMVIARRISERREKEAREEGRKEGREEGREEANRDWLAWLERWEQARAANEEFTEPPPDSPGSVPGGRR